MSACRCHWRRSQEDGSARIALLAQNFSSRSNGVIDDQVAEREFLFAVTHLRRGCGWKCPRRCASALRVCVLSAAYVSMCGDRLRVLGHSGDRWRLSLLLLLLNVSCTLRCGPLSPQGRKKKKRGGAAFQNVTLTPFLLFLSGLVFLPFPFSFVFSQKTPRIASMSSFAPRH